MPLEWMYLWLECCKTCPDCQAGLRNFCNAGYLIVFKVSLPVTPFLVPLPAVTMEYAFYKECTINSRFDCIWHEWHITCCLHLLYSDRIINSSIGLVTFTGVRHDVGQPQGQQNNAVSYISLCWRCFHFEVHGWLCNGQEKYFFSLPHNVWLRSAFLETSEVHSL